MASKLIQFDRAFILYGLILSQFFIISSPNIRKEPGYWEDEEYKRASNVEKFSNLFITNHLVS